ncbi:MAG TPA: hypothetical protein VMX96_04655 [Dehalococcoidia bacterium]|nr:hypothetical protein [Dehalococcoidia bacterium]
MTSFIQAIVDTLLILGQISLDLIGMLEGNLTALINGLIAWIWILAGMIYDAEALLEKGITLIIS